MKFRFKVAIMFNINFLLLLLGYFTTQVTAEVDLSLYYNAGVVEYGSHLFVQQRDSQSVSPERFVLKNLHEYLQFIEKAKLNNVDILVFPEATFNYFGSRKLMLEHSIELPNPNDQVAPYQHPDKYSQILGNLSKHCMDHQIYVLVNLVEKMHCGKQTGIECKRNDSYNLYNTNVVFDRYGRVISKYQKFNLFMEPSLETPDSVQYSTFVTDFNVKFGHFTCFDILFEKPALNLLKLENVSNILYPSMWYSDLPYLTAVQIHSAWAYANQINLLSAGANNPIVGSTGTGIYIGRHLNQHKIMSPKILQQLIISKVPKEPKDNTLKNLPMLTISSNAITSSPLISKEPKFTPNDMNKLHLAEVWSNFGDTKYDIINNKKQLICSRDYDLCCTFYINYNRNNITNGKIGYQYKLVVNSTARLYGKERIGGEIYCGIVACLNDQPHSCGKRFKSYDNYINEIEFEHIEIKANMRNSNILIMPSTLDTVILPLESTQYSFKEEVGDLERNRQFTIRSKENLVDLLTFGIFGRNFTADDLP